MLCRRQSRTRSPRAAECHTRRSGFGLAFIPTPACPEAAGRLSCYSSPQEQEIWSATSRGCDANVNWKSLRRAIVTFPRLVQPCGLDSSAVMKLRDDVRSTSQQDCFSRALGNHSLPTGACWICSARSSETLLLGSNIRSRCCFSHAAGRRNPCSIPFIEISIRLRLQV